MSLDRLNDYFGQLCSDESYVRPTDLRIPQDVKAPQISERQVWNSLITKVKRNSYRIRQYPVLDLEGLCRITYAGCYPSVEFIVVNTLLAGLLEESKHLYHP